MSENACRALFGQELRYQLMCLQIQPFFPRISVESLHDSAFSPPIPYKSSKTAVFDKDRLKLNHY